MYLKMLGTIYQVNVRLQTFQISLYPHYIKVLLYLCFFDLYSWKLPNSFDIISFFGQIELIFYFVLPYRQAVNAEDLHLDTYAKNRYRKSRHVCFKPIVLVQHVSNSKRRKRNYRFRP